VYAAIDDKEVSIDIFFNKFMSIMQCLSLPSEPNIIDTETCANDMIRLFIQYKKAQYSVV
jgi:hypothetical protein